MNPPKGILFDFGDTIFHEVRIDPQKSFAQLMQIAKNPRKIKVEEVRDLAVELDKYIRPNVWTA